jgi:thioredoxin-related protein
LHRRPFLISYLAGLVCCCTLFPQVYAASRKTEGASGKIEWLTSYTQGRQIAAQRHQLMIISLETDWCTWCTVMDEEVFSDAQVSSLLHSKYICIRLNAESNPEGVSALGKFHVFSFPATVVVDPTDELFVTIRGYREAPSLIAEVDAATHELHNLAELRARVSSSSASFDDRVKLAQAYAERSLYASAASIYQELISAPGSEDVDQSLFDLAVCRASAGQNTQALEALRGLNSDTPIPPGYQTPKHCTVKSGYIREIGIEQNKS